MNPIEQYIALIHNRQQNPLPEGHYGEHHHIIPRACGGSDEGWNLVKLTPEEHYRCHCLLPLIYTTGEEHKKMVFAWKVISKTDTISSEEFANLREKQRKANSEKHKGKRLSEETKRKMSEAHKGLPRSEEHKRNLSEANKGQVPWNKGKTGVYSEETKRKKSEAVKGRPWSAARRLAYERKYGVA